MKDEKYNFTSLRLKKIENSVGIVPILKKKDEKNEIFDKNTKSFLNFFMKILNLNLVNIFPVWSQQKFNDIFLAHFLLWNLEGAKEQDV